MPSYDASISARDPKPKSLPGASNNSRHREQTLNDGRASCAGAHQRSLAARMLPISARPQPFDFVRSDTITDRSSGGMVKVARSAKSFRQASWSILEFMFSKYTEVYGAIRFDLLIGDKT